jgi:hypothetical protein
MRTGRAGRSFAITIRTPGSHSCTTETACSGSPHIRSRIVVRVPTRIGRASGRYSRIAGSITVAVVGSARKSNAHCAGTSSSTLSATTSAGT